MRYSVRRIGQVAVLGMILVSSAGCSWLHHGKRAKCREPTIGTNAKNLPPLRVPSGLDAPDTRNAVKIPPLTEPEHPRGLRDPCLSSPPSYKS